MFEIDTAMKFGPRKFHIAAIYRNNRSSGIRRVPSRIGSDNKKRALEIAAAGLHELLMLYSIFLQDKALGNVS